MLLIYSTYLKYIKFIYSKTVSDQSTINCWSLEQGIRTPCCEQEARSLLLFKESEDPLAMNENFIFLLMKIRSSLRIKDVQNLDHMNSEIIF
jgi:hypothetical protein